MDIIKTYLENMFSGIKMTPEVTRVRNDLLISMEDKYNELKINGKTENEAIGIVISEFGNIDELKRELNIEEKSENSKNIRIVELAEIQDYFEQKRKNAKAIAISTSLIITGVAFFILIVMQSSLRMDTLNVESSKFNMPILLGLILLILFVAISVGIILMSNSKLVKFDFISQKFILPEHVKQYVESERNRFIQKNTLYNIIGVMLCIISVLFIIVPAFLNDDRLVITGVTLMLLIVAVAVFFLVFAGIVSGTFQEVLKSEQNAVNSKAEKLIEAVAGVFWTTIIAVYLLVSFFTERWDISWIIWPVSAMLFGGFSALVTTVYKND